MIIIDSKTVEQTKVEVGCLMQPEQANIAGNIHGGEVLKLMDNSAGIVASRHAGSNVVTARVDRVEFHYPIHIGNFVNCKSKMTFVGRSSMEVSVTVLVEDVFKDEEPKVALTGYFTFVALDSDGKPRVVPSLEITNEEEQKIYDESQKRYLEFKKYKNNL